MHFGAIRQLFCDSGIQTKSRNVSHDCIWSISIFHIFFIYFSSVFELFFKKNTKC